MADQLHVRLSFLDRDPDRLERVTAALCAELRDEAKDVKPVRDTEAPPDTRGADLATIGNLLVTVAPGIEALRQTVHAVRGWLDRGNGQLTAELTIDGDTIIVTGISRATQDRLIEAWLERHGSAPERER